MISILCEYVKKKAALMDTSGQFLQCIYCNIVSPPDSSYTYCDRGGGY